MAVTAAVEINYKCHLLIKSKSLNRQGFYRSGRESGLLGLEQPIENKSDALMALPYNGLLLMRRGIRPLISAVRDLRGIVGPG